MYPDSAHQIGASPRSTLFGRIFKKWLGVADEPLACFVSSDNPKACKKLRLHLVGQFIYLTTPAPPDPIR